MNEALLSVQRAGNEVEAAARNMNNSLGQERFGRMADKSERALDQFSVAMTNMNDIFDDPEMREDLRRALRELPDTLTQTRDTLNKANSAFDSMKQASDRASQNLANLENFTKPLGERGPQLVDNIDGSLANINELLEQLVTFSDGLNSRQGTLGRILHDDQLYLRLERTLMNAEDISSRIKPILDDIRIFSDKIARDPRQLGLKGALDRRPIGTGTKGSAPVGYGHDYGYDPAHEPIIVESEGWDPVVLP
jgi:phospholipid/cholesterol/gamma-HCH transport system substrate-binding protein